MSHAPGTDSDQLILSLRLDFSFHCLCCCVASTPPVLESLISIYFRGLERFLVLFLMLLWFFLKPLEWLWCWNVLYKQTCLRLPKGIVHPKWRAKAGSGFVVLKKCRKPKAKQSSLEMIEAAGAVFHSAHPTWSNASETLSSLCSRSLGFPHNVLYGLTLCIFQHGIHRTFEKGKFKVLWIILNPEAPVGTRVLHWQPFSMQPVALLDTRSATCGGTVTQHCSCKLSN